MYFDFIQKTVTKHDRRYAHLLNLCMPGLGLFYWGYHKKAIYWLLGFYLSQIICMVLSIFLPLTPQLLMCCCICIWLYTQGNLALFIYKHTSHEILWSRYSFTWPTYLLGAGFIQLSLCILYFIVFHNFYMKLKITDEDMFPQIIPQDYVMINRTAFQWHPPQLADIVAVQCNDDQIRIRRIVQKGMSSTNQSLRLKGFMMWENQQAWLHEKIKVNIESLPTPIQDRFTSYNFYYEYTPSKQQVYVIAHPKYPNEINMQTFEISLDPHMFFVLPDMRHRSLRNLSCAGIIHAKQIIGKVEYVLTNESPELQPYSRQGIQVH